MKIEGSSLVAHHDLLDKEKRNILMLNLICRKGVISRSEITKTTGINAVSVSNYINNFIAKKLVHEKGFDISTGGRKPELVEINLGSNYIIGLDIGKAQLRAVFADIGLNITARKQVARPSDREVPGAAVSLIKEIISSSGVQKSDIKAIGLGIANDKFIAVADALRKSIGIDAFAAPAAVCAAFAEKRKDQNVSAERLLYMYSDVGEGVVITGDTYLGASDDEKLLGGKLKYLRPWDKYLSITESAFREVARGVGTKIVHFAKGDIKNITGEVVLEAAAAGDEVALNIVQSVGVNLGLRIAYLVNLFSPEIIVIGGGIEAAGDTLFAQIKKMVERFAFRDNIKNMKIVAGTLGEDAVEVGAANLATREIFINA